MTIPCPCCRASNETATCRRCKADLSLLVALETRRQYLLDEARFGLSERRCANAALDEASGLRDGADVAQFRALAALLKGDYAGAIRLQGEPTVSTVG